MKRSLLCLMLLTIVYSVQAKELTAKEITVLQEQKITLRDGIKLSAIDKNSNSEQVKSVAAKLAKELATTAPKNEYIVLKNITIIDMLSERAKKGNVLLKGDKIQAIDYSKKRKAPKGSKVLNLKGKYLIPGLIDGHVHITHGTFEDAKHHLEQALRNGVTGVRDMGGDGRMLTLLKRNTLIGEDLGSDVYFSAIIAGSEFFERDPRPQQVAKGAKAGEVSWQKAITHDTDLRQVIAELKGMGATAIKVYLNVDKKLFKKVAAEAKRQGIKVWAHAVVPPTKGIDITNGGAEVMSHAGDLVQYEFLEGDIRGRHDFKSKEEAKAYRAKINSQKWNEDSPEVKRLFTAMKNNDSILDATLHVYNSDHRTPKDLERALKTVRIAHQMEVKIAAGSDNMIAQDKDGNPILSIHGELELLTRAGLSNFQALQAATIINAEVVGEKDRIGSIERGKIANLVVLNANPLKDINNTKDIDFVIKRGKIIKPSSDIEEQGQ